MSGGVASGRDALAKSLYEAFEWGGCEGASWDRRHEETREKWRQNADALLASGAVREEAAVRAEALAPIRELCEIEWLCATASDDALHPAVPLEHIRAALAPQDPA